MRPVFSASTQYSQTSLIILWDRKDEQRCEGIGLDYIEYLLVVLFMSFT